MAKHFLDIIDDFNFDLIGLCSHYSDYRMCWSLNERLQLRLQKAEHPFIVSGKNGKILSSHSFYEWADETENVMYFLIQNNGQGKFLIPEKSQIDYFLIVKESGIIDIDLLMSELNEMSSVQYTEAFDPHSLKSAPRLILE